MSTQEERFDRIAKGQVAQFLQNQLADLVLDREGEILNSLINSFNSGRLNYEFALSRIAAIAELRRVMGDLERQAQKGIYANEQEKGNGIDGNS